MIILKQVVLKKTKPRKKIILTFIAVLVVAVISFGGYFIYSVFSLDSGSNGYVENRSYERNISEDDYTIQTSQNTYSYVILITPKKNKKMYNNSKFI